MKRTSMMILALAALAVTTTAHAQLKCPVTEVETGMVATVTGESYGTTGGLKVAVHEDCSEAFGLLVLADLGDGTLLVVEGTNSLGTFTIGTVTMFQGIGELYIESERDESSLFPLADLQTVRVLYPPESGIRAGSPILLEATL